MTPGWWKTALSLNEERAGSPGFDEFRGNWGCAGGELKLSDWCERLGVCGRSNRSSAVAAAGVSDGAATLVGLGVGSSMPDWKASSWNLSRRVLRSWR